MARIAVPLARGFEDSEFTVPQQRLREAGHELTVFGARAGETVEGKQGNATATLDAASAELDPESFDALVIPGGHSPDHLRLDANAVALVKAAVEAGKPVAAICHAGHLLIEAGVVADRTLTSWPSIRTDLENAGAHWTNQALVEDGPLITSRAPEDLPDFIQAIERRLAVAAS